MTGSVLPAQAVEMAAQEDAALLAFRIMDRDPIELTETLLAQQEARHCRDIPVMVGGIIGRIEAEKLRAMGIVGVFTPGAKLGDIIACAREACDARGVATTEASDRLGRQSKGDGRA